MISVVDVYQAFNGLIGLNTKIMREYCQISIIELVPRSGSSLRLSSNPGASFRLPLDCVIAPSVIVGHAWDTETITLARGIIEGRIREAVLVDVGANIGLFARQMLNVAPEFRSTFLYEPHPENHGCLVHNMAPFPQAIISNVALGADAGVLDFHLDPINSGNYSLNPSAMPPGSAYTTMRVPVKDAHAEAQVWLAAGLPIFYKSDTQGHDEAIATSIGIPLWEKVFAGIFELWRIEKPSWSTEKMTRVLDLFPYKRFLQDPGVPISTADILSYVAGSDGAFKDVLFWK